MAEKFTFTGEDGQSQTIEGVAAFKAFLAEGGLAYLEGLPAKAASAAQSLPDHVRARLDALLSPILDIAAGLESARLTDRNMRAGGRYAAEFMQAQQERLRDAQSKVDAAVASIPDVQNKTAAQAYVDASASKIALTDAEAGYFNSRSAAVQDPAREAARALMQSIVDGTVDPLTADLDELEMAYLSYHADAEIAALFERAVDVVMEAAAKATEGIA